jgi:hypothetical protein
MTLREAQLACRACVTAHLWQPDTQPDGVASLCQHMYTVLDTCTFRARREGVTLPHALARLFYIPCA